MMRLGLSSFTAGWAFGVDGFPPRQPWDENDLLALAAQWNITCIQTGDNLPVHAFSHARRAAFKRHTDGKLRVEIGARGLTPEHLQAYIDLARDLKSPLIRFVADDGEYKPTPTAITGILRDFVPALEQHNLFLGIENHDRFKAETLARIMEDVDSPHVGICLDTANSLGAGEGLATVAETLAPYTINLHLKDFTFRRFPHKMGFVVTGTPAGDGLTDIPWLLELLQRYKRCQSVILEVWTEPENDLDKTLAREAQNIQKSLTYLSSISDFYGQILKPVL